MGVSAGFKAYALDQLSQVAPVTTRSMFGGLTFFAEGRAFALADDDVLYFKVDDSNRPDFQEKGMEPFRPFGDPSHVMQYYQVPEDVMEDLDELGIWMDKAMQVAARAKRKKRGALPAILLGLILLACGETEAQRLVKRAEAGDLQAQVMLAEGYRKPDGGGIAPREDLKESLRWFRSAADQGSAVAMFRLATLATTRNEEAVKWLKHGAELGNRDCMKELADSYILGWHGLPKDRPASIYWMLKAEEEGFKQAGDSQEVIQEKLKERERDFRATYQLEGTIRPLP